MRASSRIMLEMVKVLFMISAIGVMESWVTFDQFTHFSC